MEWGPQGVSAVSLEACSLVRCLVAGSLRLEDLLSNPSDCSRHLRVGGQARSDRCSG